MGAFGKMFTLWQHLILLLLPLFTPGLPTPISSPPSPSTPPSPSSPRPCTSSSPSQKQSSPSSSSSPAPNSFTSPPPSSPRPSPSGSSQKPFSSPAPTPSPSASPFPSSPRPTSSTGVKEKVEGDYEQTSPPSSNDWHFVRITAKPGSDKVFIWKNKAGVAWELILTSNMEENDGVLVFKVGEDCPYMQLGYTQARLFIREDKIEIEGPNGIYTKKN